MGSWEQGLRRRFTASARGSKLLSYNFEASAGSSVVLSCSFQGCLALLRIAVSRSDLTSGVPTPGCHYQPGGFTMDEGEFSADCGDVLEHSDYQQFFFAVWIPDPRRIFLRLWGNALDNCIKWSLGPPVDCCCSDWALGSFPLTVAASGPSKVLVLCGLEQLLSSVQLADCLLRCRNNFILSIGQAGCCSVLSPGKWLRTADVIGLSAISY